MFSEDRWVQATSSVKENKMKSKRTQGHPGPSWQGKGGKSRGKTAHSKAMVTFCASHPPKVKPFSGKVFYLDLPSSRTAGTLEKDIKELGGTVEKFFSKEIKYLVTNKREAKYVQCLRQDSPVPSPDSGQSSPQPCSNLRQPGSCSGVKSKTRGQTDTVVKSRGKSLVEKVMKEKERIQMNKILSNALEWGVKILYIDDVMTYVEKKKKNFTSQRRVPSPVKTNVKAVRATKQSIQKCKGGRIIKPFIKVEDSTRHYRPIYLTMPNMPELNLKMLPPCSPFCFEDKDHSGTRQRAHRGAKASASEERAHGRRKNKDKKRGGYCECCMIKYEDLTSHVQSQCHKAFSKSDEYLVVDRLVSSLHCGFTHIKTQVNRPKRSASSFLIAPGPCGKTEIRHKGDLNTTEGIIEYQKQIFDDRKESFLGHTLKTSSVPRCAPLIHRESNGRNCITSSDRSKHKSLAHKRPCRQNSLTSCTKRTEQDDICQQEMETAPSRGESPASIPSGVCQVDPAGKISHTDTNSPNFHSVNVSCEIASGGLNVITNQQEESDKTKDSSPLEVVQHGNPLSRKMTGKDLSEREEEEGSPLTQSFSPVRKIQRKIRVYKQKTVKINTQVTCREHLKPKDGCDDSIMKLRELFHSSDDMDVEFPGFGD